MRQKSEKKREHILEVASALFCKQGLDGVSMADISEQVGGSKATLYNYFSSKEELFVEVMLRAAYRLGAVAIASLDDDLPLRERLARFGREYLHFMLSKDMIRIRKLIYMHAERDNIGQDVYNRGLKFGWGKVEALLEDAVKRRELRPMDCWRAAMQLHALFEAELINRALLAVDKNVRRQKIEENVDTALDIFFQIYKV